MTSQKIERRGTPLDQDAGYLRQLIAESALIERKADAIAEEIRSEFTSGFIVDFNDLPLEDRQMLLAPLHAAETLCGELDALRDQLCDRFNALLDSVGGEPEPTDPAKPEAPSKPANPNASILGYAIRYADGYFSTGCWHPPGNKTDERDTVALMKTREDAEERCAIIRSEEQIELEIIPVPMPAIPAVTNEASAER